MSLSHLNIKKKNTIKSPHIIPVKKVLKKYNLHSVCEEAHCPNIAECFAKRTATFLIMGDTCTRNCSFCNIKHAEILSPLDPDEPKRIAMAVKELGLKYVVITSVTRDDLSDGGASHFANTIDMVRALSPDVKIEVLTPDFKGDTKALDRVYTAMPDVFNHNLETISRLYPEIRPQADYRRSLEVLNYMKSKGLIIKSGIMLGLGESPEEVIELMKDLRMVGTDIFTIGQYLRPSKRHYPVKEYISDALFDYYHKIGMKLGFSEVYSGRFVRSSFNAYEIFDKVSSD